MAVFSPGLSDIISSADVHLSSILDNSGYSHGIEFQINNFYRHFESKIELVFELHCKGQI